MSLYTAPASIEEAERLLDAARNRDTKQGLVFEDRVLVRMRDERISFLKGWLAARGIENA